MQKKIRNHTTGKVPFLLLAGEKDVTPARCRSGSGTAPRSTGCRSAQAVDAIDGWITRRANTSPTAEAFAYLVPAGGGRCRRRSAAVPDEPELVRRTGSASPTTCSGCGRRTGWPTSRRVGRRPDGGPRRTGRDAERHCPFCRIPTLSDEDGLIVARGEQVYAVLNLFPYNPGHLMVVPFRHMPDYTDLDADELAEFSEFTRHALGVDPGGQRAARVQHRDQRRARRPAPASPRTCTSTWCRAGAGTRTSCPSSARRRCCRSCWPTPAGCSRRPGSGHGAIRAGRGDRARRPWDDRIGPSGAAIVGSLPDCPASATIALHCQPDRTELDAQLPGPVLGVQGDRPDRPGLLRAGLSPDLVTVIGTIGVVAGSVALLGTGHLFWGCMVVTVFVLADLVDGAMARARGYGTDFGVVLDASCDRIADGALFGALAFYAFSSDQRVLGVAALICLVTGQVISYVKARADSVQPEDRRRDRRTRRTQRARSGRRRAWPASASRTRWTSACGSWRSPAWSPWCSGWCRSAGPRSRRPRTPGRTAAPAGRRCDGL